MRVGDETLTVPKYGGVLVGPDQLRQVFNDTDDEVLWLIVGAPEELEFLTRLEIQDGSVADLSGRSQTVAKGTRRRAVAAEKSDRARSDDEIPNGNRENWFAGDEQRVGGVVRRFSPPAGAGNTVVRIIT